MKYKVVAVALAVGVAVAGCATAPDKIQAASLSPLAYKERSCKEIAAEFNRVSAHARELHAVLKERADTDAAQMGIGMLLLWPTLLWLDGDGVDTEEYAKLKGEQVALEEAAAAKQCELSRALPSANGSGAGLGVRNPRSDRRR